MACHARRVPRLLCLQRASITFYDFNLPEGKSREVPESRTVADSTVETILPFSTDERLRAEYLSFRNQIRIGKLLENMDLAAGQVAYLHADPYRENTVMVTAACDRITLQNEIIHTDYDIKVRGFPTYVGRSSMEIRVELTQEQTGAKLTGYFLFASRNAKDFSSKVLPALTLSSPEEEKLFKHAKERKEHMKRDRQNFDIMKLPTPEERIVIHELFLARKNGAKERPLKETRFDSTIYMHPREQNIHGHIFGGYLMRKAFEIAFLTACTFSHASSVDFLLMDEIQFLAPVKIGQILNCSAIVTYTSPKLGLLQVSVEAHVVNPLDRSVTKTNTFQFTFHHNGELEELNPGSYEESMKYLVGRRIMNTAHSSELLGIMKE
uniref:HotDog ACOT-type domain-containing protein n=1 Tax=Vannella robusta TaxID=1487602 RepID=A0A7S4HL79_9EUKA